MKNQNLPDGSQDETLKEEITQLRFKEEEERARILAEKLNLPYLNYFKFLTLPIENETLKIIDEKEAKAAKTAVFQKLDKKLRIAAVDPNLESAQNLLKTLKEKGFQLSLFIVSEHSFKKALLHYRETEFKSEEITEQISIAANIIEKFQKEIKDISQIKEFLKNFKENQETLLEFIIAGGLGLDASDIHLEITQDNLVLRMRLDGLLYEIAGLNKNFYPFLLTRIKLLSNMKLNIQDQAQDGRFTILADLPRTISAEKIRGKTEIEVRVSCLPGAYGENIVMRILNPSMLGLDLKDLGFRQDLLKIIQKEIEKPNGLIVATGPTGSGKTTTLYACLKAVNKPEIKIITLEDPIEYHLKGITQTQVETKKGYTFAAGLRAILRQDPDVILVGEIRDKDTAEIALQSSLTGHLVFSTLHTNDAAGALPRFIELGAKPPILASGLNLVIAQRLLRKLCPKCKETENPSAGQIKEIKKALTGQKTEIKKIYRAKGCAECNQTGYKGRIGIFEMILIDEKMEKFISSSPSHAEVLSLMGKKGAITMEQDALLKVLEGITSFEELKRVLG